MNFSVLLFLIAQECIGSSQLWRICCGDIDGVVEPGSLRKRTETDTSIEMQPPWSIAGEQTLDTTSEPTTSEPTTSEIATFNLDESDGFLSNFRESLQSMEEELDSEWIQADDYV